MWIDIKYFDAMGVSIPLDKSLSKKWNQLLSKDNYILHSDQLIGDLWNSAL